MAQITVFLQRPGDDGRRFRSDKLHIALVQGSTAEDLMLELARVGELDVRKATNVSLRIKGQPNLLNTADVLQDQSIIEVSIPGFCSFLSFPFCKRLTFLQWH